MGWKKLYTNNRTLSEPDSWSRTPLDEMTGVELIHNDKKLAIYGPGEYWQSDTYTTEVVLAGTPKPHLTTRRVEKRISDLCFARLDRDSFGLIFDFRDQSIGFRSDLIPFQQIWAPWDPKSQVKLDLPIWLILELDVINNKYHYYTSKDRI